MLPSVTLVPPPEPPELDGSPKNTAFDNIANRNEQECREALQSHVAQNLFYGKECADEMTIQLILPSKDLHVRR